MKSKFDKIELYIYGESHADKIGVRLAGIPAGEKVDLIKLAEFMKRRQSGKNAWSTPRLEKDEVIVESGINNGTTTGETIVASIANESIKKADYNEVLSKPRPSHSDYVSFLRDGAIATGGGRFSGRMTAPLCIAGALALQMLAYRNIEVYAYISSIGDINCGGFFDDKLSQLPVDTLKSIVKTHEFDELPLLDNKNRQEIEEAIIACKKDGDSLGGIIECVVFGLPGGGLGDAMFDGLDCKLAQSIFAVPAVRGVEFGDGFAIAHMKGSEANDEFFMDNGKVATLTNHSGGINGGITNGMPVIIRVAIRPTASIAKLQRTVDLEKNENTEIAINGRHDICIVPRAVPCVESAVALAILDEMILRNIF